MKIIEGSHDCQHYKNDIDFFHDTWQMSKKHSILIRTGQKRQKSKRNRIGNKKKCSPKLISFNKILLKSFGWFLAN